MLIRANQRRYGGYLTHIGVISMAVGIAASSTFRAEIDATLRPGEEVMAPGGNYTVRFDELWGAGEPQRFVVGATVTVVKEGKEGGRVESRLSYYTASQTPMITLTLPR